MLKIYCGVTQQINKQKNKWSGIDYGCPSLFKSWFWLVTQLKSANSCKQSSIPCKQLNALKAEFTNSSFCWDVHTAYIKAYRCFYFGLYPLHIQWFQFSDFLFSWNKAQKVYFFSLNFPTSRSSCSRTGFEVLVVSCTISDAIIKINKKESRK